MDQAIPPGYEQSSGGLLLPTQLRAASALSDLTNPTAWVSQWSLGGQQVSAGVSVSHQTMLGLAAYYDCIRSIAEDVAKLPLPIYQEVGGRREKRRDHGLWTVLNRQANDDMTAFVLRRLLMYHVLGWGNAYALILRDQSMIPGQEGQPTGLHPLYPSCVTARRGTDGQLLYDITQRGHPTQIVPASDMLHFKGLSQDGLTGMSILQIAARSMGLSIAAQDYGASFFGNASTPGGILTVPTALSDPSKDNLRKSMESYRGPSNAGKYLLLENGIEFSPIAIPPEQAQYLSTRTFQVREIARWFRMPLTKVGDLEYAHYANMEQENIAYATDTLGAWLTLIEQEIQVKLLGVDSPYYAKHTVNALMRGDSAARAEFFRTMIANGIYSPNDVLELEDMNGYEGGDEHFMQLNMAPVRKIVDGTAQAKRLTTRPVSPADIAPAARNGQHSLVER
jgi:HK97 family phage portal protein